MTALLDEARQKPWHYEWLPLSGVNALVALVATAVLRPAGHFSTALSRLQAALETIDTDLSSGDIPIGVRFLSCFSLSLPPISLPLLSLCLPSLSTPTALLFLHCLAEPALMLATVLLVRFSPSGFLTQTSPTVVK